MFAQVRESSNAVVVISMQRTSVKMVVGGLVGWAGLVGQNLELALTAFT